MCGTKNPRSDAGVSVYIVPMRIAWHVGGGSAPRAALRII
ncbi:hypothetical protein XOC_0497 [Xanthomonas oryzae pv. oryzicola BLS256]|uniref:Uncharacterized protein n=1 Tax=Xanthomonas oryzae pv. oryzicola (strain BLS256) TaxID=383407 RepID=G7T9Q9_XANOB|nr:hypothetical protein XOC_0497 [Xanthomonas oryzae pv. oryzicola BLS256]